MFESKIYWIPVNEDLPKYVGEDVLVVVEDHGKITVEADEWEGNRGEYDEDHGERWIASGFYTNSAYNVMYWAHLPEPPKEVK